MYVCLQTSTVIRMHHTAFLSQTVSEQTVMQHAYHRVGAMGACTVCSCIYVQIYVSSTGHFFIISFPYFLIS